MNHLGYLDKDILINGKGVPKPSGWKKGSFVVIIDNKIIIEYFGLQRPFQELRDLDLDSVVKEHKK